MEAVYAYYCLHKLKMLPSQFLNLDRYEKAFVIASIDVRVEREKREADSIKSGQG